MRLRRSRRSRPSARSRHDCARRPTVEVAHEALIRTWPRFRTWIDANREKLRARAVVRKPRPTGSRTADVSGRCLIIADGFYEFTDPEDKKKKRKDKWLFTKKGEPWFCIAGIWRATKDVGEAFTMLTMEPGTDIAPYHDRQIAILDRADWADWLDPSVSAKSVLKPLSAGSLSVEQIG